MLHIHNGDCTADVARRSSIPGEHFAWREALISGPTPRGLSAADWKATRVEHLTAAYSVEKEFCEREFAAQEEVLRSAAKHDEIVLWFEHDLFCQVNLIYLLSRLAAETASGPKISLVSIDRFPGKENFRGLGELKEDELASLFPARQAVTTDHFDLAQRAWDAYCSQNPADVELLIASGTDALPFLQAALIAHLKRFPSTANGLGQIEHSGLQILESGSTSFAGLFERFSSTAPVYGLGDSQFWLALRRMKDAKQPLLEVEPNGNGGGPPRNATFTITQAGINILSGADDFVRSNGIDLWLGGVHLNNDNLWRWDPDTEQLVFG
jgi:hypothetical protein